MWACAAGEGRSLGEEVWSVAGVLGRGIKWGRGLGGIVEGDCWSCELNRRGGAVDRGGWRRRIGVSG